MIVEEDIDSNNDSAIKRKNEPGELRISYINGMKGAMDDIENYPPSSNEDEVIA